LEFAANRDPQIDAFDRHPGQLKRNSQYDTGHAIEGLAIKDKAFVNVSDNTVLLGWTADFFGAFCRHNFC